MATRASTAITINSAITLSTTVAQMGNTTQTNLGTTTPSAWGAVVLELVLTNGSIAPTKGIPVIVNYAFSNQNVTIANLITAPATLVLSSRGSFSTVSSAVPNAITLANSGAVPILGDYLYTWIEVPDSLVQGVTATLTASQATLVA